MKTALTIAGTDSSGGAGIQADIKTMTANGVYAMSAVTALTAQNTTGVCAIMEVSADFLEKQIATTVTDIFPDAVKTGMIFSSALIEVTCDCVKKFELKNFVLDPVMVATSGSRLISEDAIETLKKKIASARARNHAEHSRGGSFGRNENPKRKRNGRSLAENLRRIRLRGFGKGRAFSQ